MFKVPALTAIVLMSAAPAWAQTQGYVPTQALDSYFAQTFGEQFKLTGPVEVLAPETIGKRQRYWGRITLARMPVAAKGLAKLETDLTLTMDLQGDTATLKAGTVLYRAVFRRYADDTRPIEAWCGNYTFNWGLAHDKTAYNMACISGQAGGKMAAFVAPPNRLWYTNGTSKVFFNNAPLPFVFHLEDTVPQSSDFPALTPLADGAEPLLLTLQVFPPYKKTGPKSQDAQAVWMLSAAGNEDHSEGYTLVLPVAMHNNHVQIGLGDTIIDSDFDPESTSATHVALQAGVAGHPLPQALDGLPSPTEQDGDLYLYYGPLDGAADVSDTAWRFGAMGAAPDTIVLTDKPLKKGDTLLTAQARLADRYVVTKAPERELGVPMLTTGDYVYAYAETRYAPDGTAYRYRMWCASALSKALLVTEYVGMCRPATSLGRAGSSRLKAWETDAFNGDPLRLDVWTDLTYAPAPDPAPTSESLALRVWSLDKSRDRVEIRVGVTRDDHFLGVRSYYLRFDPDGVATLHLWDRMVRLKRQDEQLIPTVLPGDGKGPAFAATVWDHDP